MERTDAAQPISITLDGSNYILWAQAMTSFLKGKKLWRIITGDVIKPVKAPEENQSKYEERLEDWDSTNHQVVTWIRNTSVTSISLQFGRFQNQNASAKGIWDFLKDRYQTTSLSHQYQLLSQLDRMRQEPEQSINGFLSQIYAIWDQISLSEPSWTSTTDAALFAAYRDQQRLIQFLMALTTDFEPVRASLLHRNPLPTLDQAISELLSEETRLGTLKSQRLDSAFAVHRPHDVQPPQSSGPPPQTPGSCTYCHSLSHELLRCPVRTCKHCHKTRPGHYQSDCWKNPNKHYQYKSNIASRPAAAATEDSDSPDSALTPQFSMTDVEAIIQQVLAKSSTSHSTALSVTLGTSSWFFDSACCNHMTSDPTIFSSISSTSHTPSIHTADGLHMPVTHIGHASTSHISLPDTYLIPALTLNLISVGQLCELGLTMIFSSSG
ncbi:hypothetical protein RHSIM_Rhsim07G0087400 [Rhododendron simsii]|uniref:Retrovirus-related Pol polyprotein from transposon TNT 1-94-like beta-barrel domain-containing protein n=1 Tax=Rhododendron simsii TaxID=118357 RepID=A0A834GPT9_RHOSS|nr:hypothetical protein RHSIM_Rhsim07G0087400 [Rhododendron simsii]